MRHLCLGFVCLFVRCFFCFFFVGFFWGGGEGGVVVTPLLLKPLARFHEILNISRGRGFITLIRLSEGKKSIWFKQVMAIFGFLYFSGVLFVCLFLGWVFFCKSFDWKPCENIQWACATLDSFTFNTEHPFN